MGLRPCDYSFGSALAPEMWRMSRRLIARASLLMAGQLCLVGHCGEFCYPRGEKA